jgi:hypothetical protein
MAAVTKVELGFRILGWEEGVGFIADGLEEMGWGADDRLAVRRGGERRLLSPPQP